MTATLGRMPNHPAAPLEIDTSEREALRALVRAGTTEQPTAMRARVILAAAAGGANQRIPGDLGVHKMTVLLWRKRYARPRLAGLADAPRPGRAPTYTRAERDRVIALTLEPPPDGTTHWSANRLAGRTGISATTIKRIWAEAGLKPHRTEPFKFSADPELEAKVRDVVGLYLAPPEHAVVLSVDEKPQIQALDRTQPMLPLRRGQVERHTHDYERHGTTSLFAALEVGTGKVTTQARARHTGDDFLAFLRRGGRGLPRGQRVLDEPGRDLVRHPDPAGDPARHVPLGQGAHCPDRGVHHQLERGCLALRLGQDRRPDPRQGRPQAVSDQRIGTLAEPGAPLPPAVPHRDPDAALPRHLDGTLVARIDVPDHAHPGVGGQDPFQLLGREVRAVRHNDHARVLAVADPHAAAVMDAHPRRARRGVHQRVEERPVGDGVRAVPHPLGLAVGGGDRARVQVVATDHK